jgi:cyanate lyase
VQAAAPRAVLHRHRRPMPRHGARRAPIRPARPGTPLATATGIIDRKGSRMDRNDVTRKILSTKVKQRMRWADIAERIGASKEWTTAAMLGQMTLTHQQAEIARELFGLDDEETAWLQIVPYKGSLPTAVPTDPLIYRWYEIVSVYGATIKELIHEEFGDGIMSAIDFSMDIQREPDPKGDRVNVVLSGKFLPYKTY